MLALKDARRSGAVKVLALKDARRSGAVKVLLEPAR